MSHALRFLLLLVLLFSQPVSAQESSGNLLESAGKFLINLGKSGAEPAASTVAENQDRNLRPQAAGSSEKRIALVIGNAAYTSSPLANPVNDARAVSKQLRALGFEVIQRENLKTREIGAVYREFRSKIQPGATALFFYAGHGLQFKGQNYFPAVDSDISSEEEVPLQSLNLSQILDNMEEAKAGVSLVFLDACRDNPFARRFRSGLRGLAKVEAASGTLIHYATKPGSVAADGEGQNGTYTEALLAQMNEPGVPVELMLKKVSNRVVAKTKGKQEPWVEGSLRGDFYFIFQGPTTVTVQPQVDPEAEAWSTAQGIGSQAAYEAYLDSYPKGRYAAAAKIKLADLKKSEKAKPTPTPLAAPSMAADDPETAFWNEVKSSNSREYYDAYVKQYPKGKYLALARLESKKLDDAAKADAAKQEAERKAAEERAEAERKQIAEQQKQEQLRNEREVWERAKGANTIAGYTAYLETYPNGQFAALAKLSKQKAEQKFPMISNMATDKFENSINTDGRSILNSDWTTFSNGWKFQFLSKAKNGNSAKFRILELDFKFSKIKDFQISCEKLRINSLDLMRIREITIRASDASITEDRAIDEHFTPPSYLWTAFLNAGTLACR